MDPNIIGRRTTINSRYQAKPDITRIMVRDMTDETYGNCAGIGWSDFCVRRVVDKIDKKGVLSQCHHFEKFNEIQYPTAF